MNNRCIAPFKTEWLCDDSVPSGQKENHGYGITQKVKEMTDSQVSISPGTMYGTLSKMEKGWFDFVRRRGKRKSIR